MKKTFGDQSETFYDLEGSINDPFNDRGQCVQCKYWRGQSYKGFTKGKERDELIENDGRRNLM